MRFKFWLKSVQPLTSIIFNITKNCARTKNAQNIFVVKQTRQFSSGKKFQIVKKKNVFHSRKMNALCDKFFPLLNRFFVGELK